MLIYFTSAAWRHGEFWKRSAAHNCDRMGNYDVNTCRLLLVWLLCTLMLAVCGGRGLAGPPFLTDDPVPVGYHHWEVYTFAMGDRSDGSNTVQWPAVEVNNGVAPNVQLHLIVPETYYSLDGASARGLGDTEFGVKYRFVTQNPRRPDIATFPLVELPSGDASKNLGNGRTWAKVPIWLEKDWSSWTAYGGAGYAFNPAPGARNYWFGGALLQRNLSARLSLGGELFFQGASVNEGGPLLSSPPAMSSPGGATPGARSSAIWNVGGQYNFTPDFSLLFSAGHSFAGDNNSVFYVALYRTWGPGAP